MNRLSSIVEESKLARLSAHQYTVNLYWGRVKMCSDLVTHLL